MEKEIINNFHGNIRCEHGSKCADWDSKKCGHCIKNIKLDKKSFYEPKYYNTVEG